MTITLQDRREFGRVGRRAAAGAVSGRSTLVPQALAVAAVTAAAVLLVALALLPAPLVLPLVGAGLLLAAASLGLVAFFAPPDVGRERVLFWSISGLMALAGLGAALLGEGAELMPLLAEREAQ